MHSGNPQVIAAIVDELARLDQWLRRRVPRRWPRVLAPQIGLDVPTTELAASRFAYGIQPISAQVAAEQPEDRRRVLRAEADPARHPHCRCLAGAAEEGPAVKILWFIPTHGDSRYLGTTHGARAASYDYFKQVAVAADSLGYEGRAAAHRALV